VPLNKEIKAPSNWQHMTENTVDVQWQQTGFTSHCQRNVPETQLVKLLTWIKPNGIV